MGNVTLTLDRKVGVDSVTVPLELGPPICDDILACAVAHPLGCCGNYSVALGVEWVGGSPLPLRRPFPRLRLLVGICLHT